MNRGEVRTEALEQAKRGGDPTAALALAVVYVGDVLAGLHAEVSEQGETLHAIGGTLAEVRHAVLRGRR